MEKAIEYVAKDNPEVVDHWGCAKCRKLHCSEKAAIDCCMPKCRLCGKPTLRYPYCRECAENPDALISGVDLSRCLKLPALSWNFPVWYDGTYYDDIYEFLQEGEYDVSAPIRVFCTECHTLQEIGMSNLLGDFIQKNDLYYQITEGTNRGYSAFELMVAHWCESYGEYFEVWLVDTTRYIEIEDDAQRSAIFTKWSERQENGFTED